MTKLKSEQIKQDGDTYSHIKKYDDESISGSPISLNEYLELYEKFGQRSYYDY